MKKNLKILVDLISEGETLREKFRGINKIHNDKKREELTMKKQKWIMSCKNFFQVTEMNNFLEEFKKIETESKAYLAAYIGQLTSILESAKKALDSGLLKKISTNIEPVAAIQKLCEKFHVIARQLRSRYNNRDTLDVKDEYDVQNLFHALLKLDFEDIRPEEWTPSYAGKCSRMDFLLKREQIVIEIKKSRRQLTAKEIGSQLIEDIVRYKAHQDCKILMCFVYDPEGLIANPKGIENDLSKDSKELSVKVIIKP